VNELLKDDNSEVKLNMIKQLSTIAKVVGADFMTPTNVAQIGILCKPPTGWRVRSEAVKMIGELCVLFGKEFYTKNFEDMFMGFLTNSAAAVRSEGIDRAKKLAEKFGSEWIMMNFVPKVNESFNADK
jgi:hypothetical protein